MKLKFILLFAVLASLFVIPQIASAGCIAKNYDHQPVIATDKAPDPSNLQFASLRIGYDWASANCTTTTQQLYNAEQYMQEFYSGSWHWVGGFDPAVYSPSEAVFANIVVNAIYDFSCWTTGSNPHSLQPRTCPSAYNHPYPSTYKFWYCMSLKSTATAVRDVAVIRNVSTGGLSYDYSTNNRTVGGSSGCVGTM